MPLKVASCSEDVFKRLALNPRAAQRRDGAASLAQMLFVEGLAPAQQPPQTSQ